MRFDAPYRINILFAVFKTRVMYMHIYIDGNRRNMCLLGGKRDIHML